MTTGSNAIVQGRASPATRRCPRAAGWLLAAWLIAAWPVADSRARAATRPVPAFGAPVVSPFGLGGVAHQAVPALADIDGDGDLDVVVGQLDGALSFFRNTGTATSPSFAGAVTNPFGLADVGGGSAASRFVDLDGDGDLDLLAGSQSGHVVLFRNTGTRVDPAFAAASADPFGLGDVGTYASPAFADVDGDGDLDAIVGKATGNTMFFANTGTATSPAFAAAVANPFGLADVGTYAAPSFADVDGDGDLDALIGDDAGDAAFFTNVGTATSPAFSGPIHYAFGIGYAGPGTSAAWGDIDGDGDLDLVVGNYFGATYLLENQRAAEPPELFAPPSANPFGLVAAGTFSAPRFADIDGDGDLDAFIGAESGTTYLQSNSGSATSPTFAAATPNPLGLTDVGARAAPAFGDLDGDGDLDALVGDSTGALDFFPNAGTLVAPAFATWSTNPFGLTSVGSSPSPVLADIDGDGDLDVFVGDTGGSTVFFPNTGTARSPAFAAAVTNPFGLAATESNPVPSFADLDGDGDLDAFVGTSSGSVVVFRNTGSLESPAFVAVSGDPLGTAGTNLDAASPTFADLDGDGDLDALIGSAGGNTYFVRNLTRQLVFEDAFESGDIGAWTNSVP